LIKNSPVTNLHTPLHHARTIKLIQAALGSAEKFMWKLGQTHPAFEEMTVQAEGLRFEPDGLLRNDGNPT
jgi:hypothetical protein